jgi:Geranylgeranyl pyrophosphate synthase
VNKFEKIIQQEIKLFDKKFKLTLSSKASLLYKITKYISSSSGKKIIPICTILSSGLSGNISSKTYRSSILIELLHTATLIHDDIVDNAQLTRGNLALNAVWKNKISVLTGDYFLSKGMQLAVLNKHYDI